MLSFDGFCAASAVHRGPDSTFTPAFCDGQQTNSGVIPPPALRTHMETSFLLQLNGRKSLDHPAFPSVFKYRAARRRKRRNFQQRNGAAYTPRRIYMIEAAKARICTGNCKARSDNKFVAWESWVGVDLDTRFAGDCPGRAKIHSPPFPGVDGLSLLPGDMF